MDAKLDWVKRFLQQEYEVRQAKCRFDPDYEDKVWELRANTFLMGRQVPKGLAFENLSMPHTMGLRPYSAEHFTDVQRRHCDEMEPRLALKFEQFPEARLGEVTRVLLGGDSVPTRLWPEYIFYVAQVEPGTRVVALAQPCLDCYGMGDGAGGSCGAIEPMTEVRCADGELTRGGLVLDLGKRGGVTRLEAPSDQRWLPLYEA